MRNVIIIPQAKVNKIRNGEMLPVEKDGRWLEESYHT